MMDVCVLGFEDGNDVCLGSGLERDGERGFADKKCGYSKRTAGFRKTKAKLTGAES